MVLAYGLSEGNSILGYGSKMSLRNLAKNSIVSLRIRMRHQLRPPAFIIIGAQRGGTTSLYHYLIQHPNVVPGLKKEIHFFDLHFDRGKGWYEGHFPLRRTQNQLTGEASPYYLFHPHAPRRIAQTYQSIKLIVLLRDPIDRAVSHYQLQVKLGNESLPFEQALQQETARLNGEIDKMKADEDYKSRPHRLFSYLSRGKYAEQLEHWHQYFTEDQLLILKSEDLFQSPQKAFSEVLTFLRLSSFQLRYFPILNKNSNDTQLHPDMRVQLEEFFAPHNRVLATRYGIQF